MSEGVAWQILDLARWAPSGDNSQPWRFEIVSDDHIVVHAFDTRRHCVYDLDGHASQVSVGALLETLRIAATLHGRVAHAVRRPDGSDEHPVIDVRLEAVDGLAPDPLHASIQRRSVQRRPLRREPLAAEARRELEAALAPDHSVLWFEGPRDLRRFAWLAVRSAKIRLTTPEAYAVHREIIEWGARYSEERVPDQALGADPFSVRSMRFALASWPRVRMMNRWFGGTLAPRLQLDWMPGVRCAAHFAILARNPPAGIDDYLAAGAAMQRFWLTATHCGLQLQPQYTPLVFARYVREGRTFTVVPPAVRRAGVVASMLERLLGPEEARRAVFMGRVGSGPAPVARSLRLPLERLRWTARDGEPGSRAPRLYG